MMVPTRRSHSSNADALVRPSSMIPSHESPYDEYLTSNNPSYDDRGRLLKYSETDRQRQDRHELIHYRQRRHASNSAGTNSRQVSPYASTSTTTLKEQELAFLERSILPAAHSPDAQARLNDLLLRVRSIQHSEPEPRIMGTCFRLSKIIQSNITSARIAQLERADSAAWTEHIDDVEQENDPQVEEDVGVQMSINRMKEAYRAHLAHREVSRMMKVVEEYKSVCGSKNGPIDSRILTSLHAFIWRTEEILQDTELKGFLSLQIDTRIACRALHSILTRASSRPSQPRTRGKVFIHTSVPRVTPGPQHDRSNRRARPHSESLPPFHSHTLSSEIEDDVSSMLPQLPSTTGHVKTTHMLASYDSDEFGSFDHGFDSSGSDMERWLYDSDGGDFEGSESPSSSGGSTPRTPLEASFPSMTSSHGNGGKKKIPRKSRSTSSKRGKTSTGAYPDNAPQAPPPLNRASSGPFCSSSSEFSLSSADEFDSESEEVRRMARETALEKLCRASGWVQQVRDAAPITLAKRQTRLSRIPTLLTVGEVVEEEEDVE